MYKIIQNKLPLPIKHTFIKNQGLHNHNTRHSQNVHIRHRTKMASNQFIYKGPEIRLSIPADIQTSNTLKQFKYKFQKYLQQANLLPSYTQMV